MSAPASQPTWDTNATNTIALTAGHKTDGFVTNEVPTSAELNEWMMLVGLWIAYLAALTAKVKSIWVGLGVAQANATFGVDGSTGASIWTATGAAVVDVPLDLPVGINLDSVTFGYSTGVAPNFANTVISIIRHDSTTSTGSDTVIATFTDSSSSSADRTHTFSAIGHVVLSNNVYRARWTGDGTGTKFFSLAQGVTQP